MDDALEGLKAVIYRKYMVLTVRNPGQLRTNTDTHTQMCHAWMWRTEESQWFRGLHLLLGLRGTQGFDLAQGPH